MVVGYVERLTALVGYVDSIVRQTGLDVGDASTYTSQVSAKPLNVFTHVSHGARVDSGVTRLTLDLIGHSSASLQGQAALNQNPQTPLRNHVCSLRGCEMDFEW